MITPVGTGSTTLQSLQAVGEGVSDTVIVQLLDAVGDTKLDDNGNTSIYTWVDWDGGQWIDYDYEPLTEDVIFEPGQGLWVHGAGDKQAIESSGKVEKDSVTMALLSDSPTAIGNPFPVPIKLQDISAVCYGGSSYCIEIQTLDNAGRTAASYTWDGSQWLDNEWSLIEVPVFFKPR